MTHTSGLGHFPDYDFDVHAPIDDDTFVRRLQQRRLPDARPRAWYYSSPAYGLLARVVERASGVPYPEFLDRHILEPLGMGDSFAGNGDDRPDLAVGKMDGATVPSMELDTMSMGAGDIWSTVHDIDRWNVGIFSDRLLAPESRAQMFTSYVDVEGFPTVAGYGYGWFITTWGDQPLYAHSGDNVGYASLNIVLPASRGRIVLLTNEQTTDLMSLALSLLPTEGQ
jgi:CubicO group peptidase (beta-lactamase class C family)